MASFSSYMAPSVTTDVVYEEGGVTLYGDTQILVLIGEGAESVTQVGVEIHRGSSAVADDLRVAITAIKISVDQPPRCDRIDCRVETFGTSAGNTLECSRRLSPAIARDPSFAHQFEPRRVCRRPLRSNYAAMAGVSSMA